MKDLIDRQALLAEYDRLHVREPGRARKLIEDAPSAQPEIIRCNDCVKHNQSYGNNGTIDSCPLVLYRGKAQGHEFDYQYCAFAERRSE